MNPFVIFWRAGRDLFDDLFLLMGLNLLWLLISGPLLAIAVFLLLNAAPIPAAVVALLAVLPLGPASAGLTTVAERIADGRVASFSLFFEGMKQHRTLAWKVYGLWAAGMIIILANLAFYLQIGEFFGVLLTTLFVYLAVVWWIMMIYLGPLMLIQKQKSLRLLWRNAAVMTLGRPIFSFLTAVLMGIIIFASVWVIVLPLLLTFSFLALWSTRATLALIAADEARRQARSQVEQPDDTPITERGRAGQVRSRK